MNRTTNKQLDLSAAYIARLLWGETEESILGTQIYWTRESGVYSLRYRYKNTSESVILRADTKGQLYDLMHAFAKGCQAMEPNGKA